MENLRGRTERENVRMIIREREGKEGQFIYALGNHKLSEEGKPP